MTVTSYCSDLRGFLNWIKSNAPDDTLELAGAEYLNTTRFSVAPKTTQRRLTSMRAFARHHGEKYFLAEYTPPKSARPIPHPIAEGIDGIRRMISYADTPGNKAMIALIGLVGLRISEARSIRPSNIDMAYQLITVRGKGDKTRVLPLSNEACGYIMDAFELCLQDDSTLIKLSDAAARTAFSRIGRKAGLKNNVSSHDGRATLATSMLNNGGNIRVVQEMLGHSNIASTQVYTGVTLDQMREAATFQ